MGESLGRYTLLRRVAAGGMAEIWKAKALGPAGFQKTVAIKRILPHLVEETEFIQMFIEEAKLAAELVHPNIIQVFDFGQLGANDYFIAMEYVSGPSLARLLKRISERAGAFPAICALYAVAESAKGLGHAHAKTDELGIPLGIVHRDVSPQNLLISYAGEVKVGDFGIAKAAGAVNRTQEGQVRGKLSYMSPEQANGRKGIDGRSDLFSLGVVLYELLTGRRLFPSNLTTVEAYGRVAGFRGLDLEDLAAVPQPFRDLVARALRPEPEDRFQDGNEFEMACTAMLGSKGIAKAREELASMVQSLFDEEKKIEMTPVPASSEIALSGESPVVLGSFSSPAALGAPPFVPAETVKSPISPLQMPGGPPKQPSPTPAPTSGLTLASAKLPIQPKQVSKVNQFPPVDLPVGVSVDEEPARRFSPAMIGAMAGGLALLVVAGGIAARIMGFGGGETAAASPTPFGTATAVAVSSATPVASAALTATPAATALEPTPIGTLVAVAATPTPAPTRAVAVKGFGTLSVTSRPWVQVWVDNKMVKPETPLTGHKLTAGRHWIRFVNAGLGFDETRMVNVQPDGVVTIQIDVRSKAITVR